MMKKMNVSMNEHERFILRKKIEIILLVFLDNPPWMGYTK